MAKKIDSDSGKKMPYSVFGLIGIVVTIIGVVILWNGFEVKDKSMTKEVAGILSDKGQYGQYIVSIAGAIFSLVGVVFLFLTFKQQGDSFRLERFESQFFELMKIYRENVAEMHHLPPYPKKNNHYVEGRKVFVEINREFQFLYRLLSRYLKMSSIIIEDPRDLIAITNLTVFFGLSREGLISLKHFFDKHQYSSKYPLLIEYITTKVRQRFANNNPNVRYHGGHQIRLGHYFRHLFQTVLFVHRQDFLTRQEKYDYIKILRGQMSNYEQAIFFYNSLSPFGLVWEMKYRDIDYKFLKNPQTDLRYELGGKEITEEDLLITEYRLIKNIPSGFTGDINPKLFYKKLPFESD